MPDEATKPEEAPELPVLNAVVVVKKVAEDGNIDVDVAMNGDVNVLEVATLLKIAAAKWSKHLEMVD